MADELVIFEQKPASSSAGSLLLTPKNFPSRQKVSSLLHYRTSTQKGREMSLREASATKQTQVAQIASRSLS